MTPVQAGRTAGKEREITQPNTYVVMALVGVGVCVLGYYFYTDAQQNRGLDPRPARDPVDRSLAPPREPAPGGESTTAATSAPPAPTTARQAPPPVTTHLPTDPTGTPVPHRAGAMTALESASLTAQVRQTPLSNAAELPSPREQQAARKPFVEGHWQGMELIELVPELAREYRLPPDTKGLLIDEVSLATAEAGLLAGDLVYRVGGMPVTTLRDFHDATYLLRDETQVEIGIVRQGRPYTVMLRTPRPLGFAQFEAASPIAPGAVSPHKQLGRACTDCHVIMRTGGQLAIDAGDILPRPPPIVPGASPAHGNRGACTTCHQILSPMAGR